MASSVAFIGKRFKVAFSTKQRSFQVTAHMEVEIFYHECFIYYGRTMTRSPVLYFNGAMMRMIFIKNKMLLIFLNILSLYKKMKKIGFGGGCHWCTEAIFQALKGVEVVEQGWISSINPYNTFSEGVIVHFNDDITVDLLIEVHLFTHSSSSAHSMRDKYRSAVYYFDSNDSAIIETIIGKLALENNTRYITRTLPFVDFRLNSEHYLNYYKKDKHRPFCQNNIDPKLKAIQQKFAQQMRSDF